MLFSICLVQCGFLSHSGTSWKAGLVSQPQLCISCSLSLTQGCVHLERFYFSKSFLSPCHVYLRLRAPWQLRALDILSLILDWLDSLWHPMQDPLLKNYSGASLVAQWLRICLLMQGTRVRALVWEDPTCRGATRPVSHNY